MRNLDDDETVDNYAEKFGRAAVNLTVAMHNYRAVRDIQGIS